MRFAITLGVIALAAAFVQPVRAQFDFAQYMPLAGPARPVEPGLSNPGFVAATRDLSLDFILVGTEQAANGLDQIVVVKFDPGARAPAWSVRYARSDGQHVRAVGVATAFFGEIYVVGTILAPNEPYDPEAVGMIALKFNTSGALQWVREYTENNVTNIVAGVAVVVSGGNHLPYFVASSAALDNFGLPHAGTIVVGFTEDGAPRFTYTEAAVWPLAATIYNDDVIVAGVHNFVVNNFDLGPAVTKINNSGVQWTYWHSGFVSSGSQVVADQDGYIYVGGSPGNVGSTFSVNPDGTLRWISSRPSQGIARDGSGFLYVANSGHDGVHTYFDVTHMGPVDGTELWTRRYTCDVAGTGRLGGLLVHAVGLCGGEILASGSTNSVGSELRAVLYDRFGTEVWVGRVKSSLDGTPNLKPGQPLPGGFVIPDGNAYICVNAGAEQRMGIVRLRVDSDRDGIPDEWEKWGMDMDNDGRMDYFLPRVDHECGKDIYVEVDVMADPFLIPSQRALANLRSAFRNAPENVVGTLGISLNIELDETDIPFDADLNPLWTEFAPIRAAHFGTVNERAAPNAALQLAAKARVFRYCLFANGHSGDSSSGSAYPSGPGSNFVVTVGTPFWRDLFNNTLFFHTRWDDVVSGTFMHELGHAMGLIHGGDQADPTNDNTYNRKPNYASVMNYTWQFPFPSIGSSWRLDFSRRAFRTLDENALTEADGIDGRVGFRTLATYTDGGGTRREHVVPEVGQCDWNGNGYRTDAGVSQSINYDGAKVVLRGAEDWSRLVYLGRPGTAGFGATPPPPSTPVPPEFDQTAFEMFQLPPEHVPGDLNCDGQVNNFDIDPFVMALTSPSQYAIDFAGCDIQNGDVSGDGNVDNFDIDPFVLLLTGG